MTRSVVSDDERRSADDRSADAATASANDDTDGRDPATASDVSEGRIDDVSEGRVKSDPERDDAHLADLEEGAGCTEIWEHLSDRRGE